MIIISAKIMNDLNIQSDQLFSSDHQNLNIVSHFCTSYSKAYCLISGAPEAAPGLRIY